MGGILCLHEGATSDWRYFTADMPYDPGCGQTPHDLIVRTGVVRRMLDRWYDCLETYHDNNIGFEYREVTVGLRGAVLEDEAQAMLDETGLPLYLADNGFVSRVTGDTVLPRRSDGTSPAIPSCRVGRTGRLRTCTRTTSRRAGWTRAARPRATSSSWGGTRLRSYAAATLPRTARWRRTQARFC